MSEFPRHEEELIRKRQRSGARMTAWVLGAWFVLIFAITIAKLTVNQ
jgi:hypothetical protein